MGHSRGGLSSKVHALVDVKGRHVHLPLTAGQRSDAPVGAERAKKVDPGATILADRAYDTNAIRAALKQKKGWTNIPAKANRKETFAFSDWLYKYRNRVERSFEKIKQFKGLATRYDRKSENYIAALKLICVRIWMNG